MGTALATAMIEGNPWDQIKNRLSAKMSPQAYQNWVQRTTFESVDGTTLRVTVPDPVTKDWMEQEYAQDIRTSLQELNLHIDQIVYSVRAAHSVAASEHSSAEPIFASAVGQIN